MNASELSGRADQIRALERKNSRNVIEIGRILRDVHSGLEMMGFREWIKSEFRWSHVTAYWYMRVADLFGKHEEISDRFQSSAMICLAKRAVPKTAIIECIRQAKAGGMVSYSVAVDVIKRHQVNQGITKTPHLTKPQAWDRLVERVRSVLKRWEQAVCELDEHEKSRVLALMLGFCRDELGWEAPKKAQKSSDVGDKVRRYLEDFGAARGRVIAADLEIDEAAVLLALRSDEFAVNGNGYYSLKKSEVA